MTIAKAIPLSVDEQDLHIAVAAGAQQSACPALSIARSMSANTGSLSHGFTAPIAHPQTNSSAVIVLIINFAARREGDRPPRFGSLIFMAIIDTVISF